MDIRMIALLLLTSIVMGQNNWQQEFVKDDITVYTAKQEGSSFKSYMVEMEIEATMEDVAALIMNPKGYKKWIHMTKESELLETISENEILAYYRADAPWPVSDRDLVNGMKRSDENEAIKIEFYRVEEGKEETDAIRMPNFKGYWMLTQIVPGKIQVKQEVHSNPGGSIPAWVANMVVTENPFKTFQNLRQLLK